MATKRNKKKVFDGFITWQDLKTDLPDILGEHTTTENEWESDDSAVEAVAEPVLQPVSDSSSGSDSEKENEHVLPPKRKKDNPLPSVKTCVYQCPLCDKLLKSIAGFRGHMQRIHNDFSVKASSCRLSGTKVSIPAPQQNEPIVVVTNMMDLAQKALLALQGSPMHNLPLSVRGKEMVSISSLLIGKDLSFYETLLVSFNGVLAVLGTGATMESDKERMFTLFHEMRFNDKLLQKVNTELESCLPQDLHRHIRTFVQVFLDELLYKAIDNLVQSKVQKSEAAAVQVDDHDQRVLMYISGYLITALSKQYLRAAKLSSHHEALKQLKSSSTSPEFLAKCHSWIYRRSRGKLVTPSDSFYLFLRSAEVVCRGRVDLDNLESSSLLTDKLQEAILEDFMVNHHWGQCLVGVRSSVSLRILDDVLTLFLRVRGFAVEKKSKRDLQLQISQAKCQKKKAVSNGAKQTSMAKSKKRPSQSLRANLKA